MKKITCVVGIVALVLVLSVVWFPLEAAKAAAVFNVPSASYPTIQSAINAASSGDTVQVAAGTYNENIILVDGVQVLGAGAGVTTIDGGALGSVVTANNIGSGTKLDGFTITNGGAGNGGGMYNNQSSPWVSNCVFSGNSAASGGGMLNYESSPTVTDCTFSDNSAASTGGMLNYESSPTVTDCTFSDNSAASTGGMSNFRSSPIVTNCIFSGNSAASVGGMYNYYYSSPTVTKCTFSNNSSTSEGGGMSNYFNSSPTVTDCIFSGNRAYDGGGMYNVNQAAPVLTNCVFSENQAWSGGGGGMYNDYFASPILNKCIFSRNTAFDGGGGLYNHNQSSPILTNCIFSGNFAYSGGGGMSNFFGSSPVLTNCTFAGNRVSPIYGGGGMSNFLSTPILTNCILWADLYGEIYNNSSTPEVTYSDIQGGYSGTGNIDIEPLFVNLVAEDYHLQLDSPCIDTGSNSALSLPATDMDGLPRTMYGGEYGSSASPITDMGAYEFTWTDLVITKSAGPEPVFKGQTLTYTITLTNNGPLDAIAVSVTDTLPPGVQFKSADTQGEGSYDNVTGIWSGLDLVNGETAIMSLVVIVNKSTADGTILTNTAAVSSKHGDPDPANNTAQITTRVVQVKGVGGEVTGVNKAGVLAPWIIAAFVLITGAAILRLRSRRGR